MKLSETEKPYVEFKRVEKDLGHDFDKGFYDMQIYLPENYPFNEIK